MCWDSARRSATLAGERPKMRQMQATVATGRSVQLRTRPRLHGSMLRADVWRKICSTSSISFVVTIPWFAALLLTMSEVRPSPVWFSSFHTAPVLPPSERAKRTFSTWRCITQRSIVGWPGRRSRNDRRGIEKPPSRTPSTRTISTGTAAAGRGEFTGELCATEGGRVLGLVAVLGMSARRGHGWSLVVLSAMSLVENTHSGVGRER